jgi:hypothetical protein
MPMQPKLLILYHYFEKDEVYKENFEFFLRHGLLDDAEHLVIINGGCTAALVKRDNVNYMVRENVGFDFGGYVDVVNFYRGIDRFDYVFFINSIVRGPFLPAYVTRPWTEPFLDLFTGDVKLAGASVNVLRPGSGLSEMFAQLSPGYRAPYSHVQTPMFVLDRDCLSHLREGGFFSRGNAPNKIESIFHYEILMSQLVLRRGWNIAGILPEYRGVDYRTLEADPNPASVDGNMWYPEAYCGRNVHPFETIFFNTKAAYTDFDLMRHLGRSSGR